MRRIAVTGGRKFRDAELVDFALSKALSKGPFVLIHGGASGADNLANQWATKNGIKTEVYRAKWGMYGKAAGPMRNRTMAKSGLNGCIAFPGGKGTENMKQECRAMGVLVWEPKRDQGDE